VRQHVGLIELLDRIDTRDLRLKRAPDPEYVCGSIVRRFKHDAAELGNAKRLALLENHAVSCEKLEGKSELTLEGHGVIDCVGGMQNVSQSGSLKVSKVDG